MKILFLLNNDIHCLKSLNSLLDHLSKNDIAVIFSQKVGKNTPNIEQLKSLKYYEQNLLIETAQHIENQNKITNFLTFNQIIKKFNIKTIEVDNINSEKSLNKVAEFAPQLVVSIRFGQILQPKFIKIATEGVINLHSGILPKYRGVLATFWAILNSEQEIGTTLHFIENAKIDDGKIINISKQKVDLSRSLIYNVFSLYDSGCRMISDFLNGRIDTIDKLQENHTKLYFTYPKSKEVEEFERKMKFTTKEDISEIYSNLN